ncbi:hypothetical protein CGZ80_15035 [Rhodopirellula sp. MGV]|nr:hypothetical protein CGZ80_15035 [Rhodopirellula sp. MGV]PNY37451.1 hypothetical protein C2E31_07990 [Rhodopirellula baltica]
MIAAEPIAADSLRQQRSCQRRDIEQMSQIYLGRCGLVWSTAAIPFFFFERIVLTVQASRMAIIADPIDWR